MAGTRYCTFLVNAHRHITAKVKASVISRSFIKDTLFCGYSQDATQVNFNTRLNTTTPEEFEESDPATSNNTVLRVQSENIKFVEKNDEKQENKVQDLEEIPRIRLPSKRDLEEFDVKMPGALDECTEDLSHLGPYATPLHSFAKYANDSYTVQQLIKLGVQLYKIERDPEMLERILRMDFEKDIGPYIRFLHDCGVPADHLGQVITKSPWILKEDMDNLRTRIRYLKAHDFNTDLISVVVTKNPNWLLFPTKFIDSRLGYFQSTFSLSGRDVRTLALRGPTVITYKLRHLYELTFAVTEEMGFAAKERKAILLTSPAIWKQNRTKVVTTFDYAHNKMNLTHKRISQQPQILLCRKSRLEQRHQFLVELNKAQYDPLKPSYVAPLTLVSGTDADFCRNVADTSIEMYNMFLKTF
ncbi:hypothetical protein KM043_009143 [Ampulex compressa]|nr:hypothetical protein KM043_009143 [Ampulex compressa]